MFNCFAKKRCKIFKGEKINLLLSSKNACCHYLFETIEFFCSSYGIPWIKKRIKSSDQAVLLQRLEGETVKYLWIWNLILLSFKWMHFHNTCHTNSSACRRAFDHPKLVCSQSYYVMKINPISISCTFKICHAQSQRSRWSQSKVGNKF